MKRCGVWIVALLLLAGGSAAAQYPQVTLRQVEEVHLDSLKLADSLQLSQQSRWTLQASPLLGQTVTITALVVVPAKVLTFTAAGYTMLLRDTGEVSQWGAIFVRVRFNFTSGENDTSAAIQDGFLNPIAGDIIRMTGTVNEFPTVPNSMNSVTQFEPLAGEPIEILSSGVPIPPPLRAQVSDFYLGRYQGKIQFSTGEPLEGLVVELTDLFVDAKFNTGRGTLLLVDGFGNQIATYDASRYFTKGHGDVTFPADPAWQYTFDSLLTTGSRIDTIRGFITTVSGSENPRGYRIAPIWYGDVVVGKGGLPLISTHRRNPVIVPPDSSPTVSVRTWVQEGGSGLSSVTLKYSLATNAPFTAVPMTYNPLDSTAVAQIPNQAAGTFVRYYIETKDSAGFTVRLANSATTSGWGSDTSRGFFFYTVLDRPLTIRDVQYTPYSNGRSPYIGATTSVRGIVTADTAHIGISSLTPSGGTNAWYIQSGTQPWNGIWVTGADTTTLPKLKNGDSVLVTGDVQEDFDVTRIGNAVAAVVSPGNPEPQPVLRTTGAFGPSAANGASTAEPYEGMLVRFANVTVKDTAPTFADPTEFTVDDGSGQVIVRRDGRHRYSNIAADTATGKFILKKNDRISSLTGVMYFSFLRYKFVPRTDADFGTITSVEGDPSLADGRVERFSLAQNYPNPFNPSTLIRYEIPSAVNVKLVVYNLLGQEVRTLVNEMQAPGAHTIRFDGSTLASGMYLYRLQAGKFTEVRKMVMVK